MILLFQVVLVVLLNLVDLVILVICDSGYSGDLVEPGGSGTSYFLDFCIISLDAIRNLCQKKNNLEP